SSQFISALLLVAGFLPTGLTLRLATPVTSRRYVQMTLDLLAALEAPARASADLGVIQVRQSVGAFDSTVEPDASSATYFWAAGALLPRATVRVSGLAGHSLQGDAAFVHELERMGCTLVQDADRLACRPPEQL